MPDSGIMILSLNTLKNYKAKASILNMFIGTSKEKEL